MCSSLSLCLSVSRHLPQHNPRGSNDRLNGGGTNRDNANRLFNSQNNDKGGYAINTYTGSMSFYESSWLTVEWTQQHSCGVENTDCAIVLQYMCGSSEEAPETLIRDGMSEQTITEANYAEKNTENPKKLQYGMHEPLDYFRNCETRERNGKKRSEIFIVLHTLAGGFFFRPAGFRWFVYC